MTLIPDAPLDEPSLPDSAPRLDPPEDQGASRSPWKWTPSIPQRTLSLFCLFVAIGTVVLAFTFTNVHRRTSATMAPNSGVIRTNFSINYWIDHGYVHSGGLLMRPSPNPPGFYVYLSSTGGHLVSGFIVEKIYKAITGHTSIRLLALHNEVVTLILAALLGLLAFRLAIRFGSPPLHALILAASVEAVHFTFPDNLALFWELSGRQPFLIFAVIFLLIEERCIERRTRSLSVAQAIAAFLLAYMEYVAGFAFLASYLVASMALGTQRVPIRRLLAVAVLPALLALGLFGLQRKWVAAHYPEATTYGGSFLFRTGLDGSTQYYGDHLDIAYRRDLARANFPPNQEHLFRWKWLFFAGTAALLTILAFGARGRVPAIALISLLSLLGTYLLYAALFSQAFVIHPYLFDVLLYTPLVLGLFVLLPALLESVAIQRGVFVIAIFLLAAWVSMVQLRDYAMWYPLPPPETTTH